MFETARLVNDARPVGLGDEHHVQVPRDGRPAAVGRFVEEVVAAVAQVHVGHDAVDRMKAVVVRQVQMLAPPRFELRRTRAVHEAVEVCAVARHAVADVFLAGLGTERVAVGQAAFLQERAVGILHDKIETPEIAVVLRLLARFLRAADHAPVDPVRVRAGHARELIRAEGNRLIHSRHATIHLHPRTRAAAQVQVIPRPRVILAPVILRVELVRVREVNAPLCLTAHVSARLPAVLILDVVEHLAVAHERAEQPPLVIAAVPLAALHVIVPRDQVIHRQRREKLRRKRLRRRLARLARARPRWHAVVAEPREVRRRIIRVRQPHRRTVRVREHHAIPHQPPVFLHVARHFRRERAVARARVAVLAVIVQRELPPALLVTRVALAKVVTRLDDLHEQFRVRPAARLEQLHRHAHALAGARLTRDVLHGLHCGRQERRENGVGLARRRRGLARAALDAKARRTPRTRERRRQPRMHALERRALPERRAWPREAHVVAEFIHDLAARVAQRDPLAAVLQPRGQRPERREAERALERRRLARHDNETARRERVRHVEAEFLQRPAAERNDIRARVVQLNEFLLLLLRRREMNLIDHHARLRVCPEK